ncbi:hypothetical protein [Actinoallomurus sp. NPDC050550]|uniref:hypothetical protein n=1 Tax=Actinoallomurus sp. NPDC050550 TaxID=3154937 RepID=UPI003411763F
MDERGLGGRLLQLYGHQGGVGVGDGQLDGDAARHPRLLALRDERVDLLERSGLFERLRGVHGPPAHAALQRARLDRVGSGESVRPPVEHAHVPPDRVLQPQEPAGHLVPPGDELDGAALPDALAAVQHGHLGRRRTEPGQVLLALADEGVERDVRLGRGVAPGAAGQSADEAAGA